MLSYDNDASVLLWCLQNKYKNYNEINAESLIWNAIFTDSGG